MRPGQVEEVEAGQMFTCIYIAPQHPTLAEHCTQFVHEETKLIHCKMWECSLLNRPQTYTRQKCELIMPGQLCSCLGPEGGLCKQSQDVMSLDM